MIKVLRSFVVITTLLAASFASAEVITVAASIGKLLNHTSLPSEAFEITYSAQCRTGMGADCGRVEFKTSPKADGTYEIPAYTFTTKAKAKGLRFGLYAFMNLPKENSSYPQGIAPNDLAVMIDERDLTDVAQLAAPKFTIFGADAGTLDLRLISGRNVQEYLKNEGRDDGVEIKIDFGLSGGENMDITVRLDQDGFNRKTWTEVPRHFFTLVGEYPADAPFDYVITEDVDQIKAGRARFSGNLVDLIGAITIDDTKSVNVVSERKLTGTFTDSYFELDYALRDKFQFAEIGFSYATLNAECVNGKIAGELIFRDGQFTSDPETSREKVTGTCQGDSGEIAWSIKTNDGKTEMLTAKFDRIRAQTMTNNRGQKVISRTLFSGDIRGDGLDVYSGDELTIFMPTYLSDGTYAGKLRVSTEDL